MANSVINLALTEMEVFALRTRKVAIAVAAVNDYVNEEHLHDTHFDKKNNRATCLYFPDSCKLVACFGVRHINGERIFFINPKKSMLTHTCVTSDCIGATAGFHIVYVCCAIILTLHNKLVNLLF
jgi:hypothetical protein